MMEQPRGFTFKILEKEKGSKINFESTVVLLARLVEKEVQIVDPEQHIVKVVGGSFEKDFETLADEGILIEILELS